MLFGVIGFPPAIPLAAEFPQVGAATVGSMNATRSPDAPAQTVRRNAPLIALGAFVALGVPAASAGMAALWSGGMIEPDPNGALIQTLQSLALPGVVLSPVGLVLALWGAGLRGAGRWAALLLWGVPLLAVLWFFSAVWLGGLAGEPF